MKKLCYLLSDNGDISNVVFPDMDEIKSIIETEMEGITEEDEIREFIITTVWLTDDELANLPEL